ncbi:hypothetical protein PG991_014390 [Apiospora marii]|uniref:Uncharacterized protein n=1 Tax=Apiospora marii TaxID=335849 RepID=A0ABR1R8V8_9PEZI
MELSLSGEENKKAEELENARALRNQRFSSPREAARAWPTGQINGYPRTRTRPLSGCCVSRRRRRRSSSSSRRRRRSQPEPSMAWIATSFSVSCSLMPPRCLVAADGFIPWTRLLPISAASTSLPTRGEAVKEAEKKEKKKARKRRRKEKLEQQQQQEQKEE